MGGQCRWKQRGRVEQHATPSGNTCLREGTNEQREFHGMNVSQLLLLGGIVEGGMIVVQRCTALFMSCELAADRQAPESWQDKVVGCEYIARALNPRMIGRYLLERCRSQATHVGCKWRGVFPGARASGVWPMCFAAMCCSLAFLSASSSVPPPCTGRHTGQCGHGRGRYQIHSLAHASTSKSTSTRRSGLWLCARIISDARAKGRAVLDRNSVSMSSSMPACGMTLSTSEIPTHGTHLSHSVHHLVTRGL